MSGNESGGTDRDSAQLTPVRLAQVVYALFPAGSELLAWRLAKGVSQAGGFACWMYAVDRSGPLAEVLKAEGMPFRAYSRRGRLDVRLIVQMARQFRSDGIQVVHTHHLGQLLYGGLAGRLAGAKVVHTEHEFYSLQRPRLRRLLKLLSGLTEAVTAVTESVTAFLRDQVRIHPAKLRTIRNGVDLARFQSAMPVSRVEFGWRGDDVVIGCVARLEPEKGHQILLEAFRLLHRRCDRVRLLLVGEGREAGRLKDLVQTWGISDAVRFVGLRMDIAELLAACDIVAMASLNEGLPMAALEAMAAGKPVVATRIGGLPELLGEGRHGLLVPAGDPVALADVLEQLVRNQTRREQLGEAGRALVSAQYAFERTLRQYRSVYYSALSRAEPIAAEVETIGWLAENQSGASHEPEHGRIEVG